MIVVVLTACPPGLRGDLTRWLLEISPGVFVGHVSARVRERLWERITDMVKDGRAIMVHSARNEQHLAFKVHHADWTPVDCDGLELIKRPPGTEHATGAGKSKTGWSNASKYHKARRFGR
ncbi:type I-E CRISPR-associated endoribonuclease Cas2e [Bifidobacterium samirii]|uniref:Type I-E CRISPR-associated endoribonuclease Cas2 n=1 Tax=Bifidobacterium samirii TaxID=2306974 RepID=A0A430FW60_9BIFI|nr:type I-E CRISPR-associated endoribonuclease Cas2e [Bifidobacterium samirii]RSX58175.1 type I-E CRISPR-associated endoribonuclease Cas2 [Bifidobacterium samirii]